MTKIIFFDFDNTLYSHYSKSVPESVYKALDSLKEKGILTCLCTGRCKYEIDNYFDLPKLKFDYYIFFNGQQILDKNFNIIYSKYIESPDKDNIIRIFNEKKIPFIIATKDDYYINFVNDLVYYTCVTCSSSPTPKIKEYKEDNIYMCSFFPGKMKKIDEFINQNFPNCYKTKWVEGSYDLVLKNISKASAIETLLDKLNIEIKDSMAFGDGFNDLEMMQTVGISIAMGNADNNIKKISTYVTDHIDDDGIYNGLKHFNIL